MSVKWLTVISLCLMLGLQQCPQEVAPEVVFSFPNYQTQYCWPFENYAGELRMVCEDVSYPYAINSFLFSFWIYPKDLNDFNTTATYSVYLSFPHEIRYREDMLIKQWSIPVNETNYVESQSRNFYYMGNCLGGGCHGGVWHGVYVPSTGLQLGVWVDGDTGTHQVHLQIIGDTKDWHYYTSITIHPPPFRDPTVAELPENVWNWFMFGLGFGGMFLVIQLIQRWRRWDKKKSTPN